MSYSLLVQNVDGAYVDGIWDKKPTDVELLYCIGGRWEAKQEQEIIEELLLSGQCDVDDGSCTSYELSQG